MVSGRIRDDRRPGRVSGPGPASESETMSRPQNILGSELEPCCTDPLTGFYRSGSCETGSDDLGLHLVCAVMTHEFLEFTRRRGNDLTTPHPAAGFPGLKPGDRWCLCVERWSEALEVGLAPPVVLAATHVSALEFVDLADLRRHDFRKWEARD
jgi:uncharacterized protein (DUF2237 family)